MEGKHFTGKLRSAYLFTLILSYTGTNNRVKNLLKLLSREGASFIEKNKDQLDYFCQQKVVSAAYLNANQHLYLSPAVERIDQLLISDCSKALRFTNCLKNVKRINKIYFDGEHSFDKPTDIAKQEMLEQYSELIQKTSKLQIRMFYKQFDYVSFFFFDSTKLCHLKHLEIFLNYKFNTLILTKVSELVSLEVLKVTAEDSKGERKFFRNLNLFQKLKLKAFTFSAQKEPLQLDHFQVLAQNFQALTNLKLTLVDGIVGTTCKVWENFSLLEKLALDIDDFDFEILKFLPRVRIINLICEQIQFKPNDEKYLNDIEEIHLKIKTISDKKSQLILGALKNAKKIYINFFIKSMENLRKQSPQILEEFFSKVMLENAVEVMKGISVFSKLKFLALEIKLENSSSLSGSAYQFALNPSINHLELDLSTNEKVHDAGMLSTSPTQYTSLLIGFIKSLQNLKKLTFSDSRLNRLHTDNFFKELLIAKPNLSVKINQAIDYQLSETLLIAMKEYNEQALTHVSIIQYSSMDSFIKMLIQVLEYNKSLISLNTTYVLGQKGGDKVMLSKFFHAIKQHPRLVKVRMMQEFSINQMKALDLESMIIQCCGKLKELQLIKYLQMQRQCDTAEKERKAIQWIREKERMMENIQRQLPNLMILAL